MVEKKLLENLIRKDYTLLGSGRWLHAREHDSLVVDTERQIFFWNSKEIVGDAFIWLTKIKGYSTKDAKEYLKKYEKYEIDTDIVINKYNEEVTVYPKLVDIFWSLGKNNREYWYKRTLSDNTIDRFKLGFYNGWYTIPLYEDGKFKNFQLRRDEPEKMIKSYYEGMGTFLFNAEILKFVSTVFLTESPTDCMILNQNGIPAVSQNGGANNWKYNWFKEFIKIKQVYIVYDNDSAGRFGAMKVSQILGEFKCKVFTFDGFSEHYDSGNFFMDGNSATEYVNLIKSNSKYCFEYPEFLGRKRK